MKFKAAIPIAILLFSSFMAINAQSVTETNSKEVFAMLQNTKKWVILDVRTPGEFSQGHIKGAINIDINQPDALTNIGKLDHKAKYIVHCRTNHRSKIAVDYMTKNGFKTVYQMMDGMNGWMQNKLPTEK
jgi:phage shock protein E